LKENQKRPALCRKISCRMVFADTPPGSWTLRQQPYFHGPLMLKPHDADRQSLLGSSSGDGLSQPLCAYKSIYRPGPVLAAREKSSNRNWVERPYQLWALRECLGKGESCWNNLYIDLALCWRLAGLKIGLRGHYRVGPWHCAGGSRKIIESKLG
jgi:hypothetical protein